MNYSLLVIPFVYLTFAAGCSSGSSSDEDGTAPSNETPDTTTSRTLNVVSWGGAYERSQVEAYHKPWTALTGHQVNSIDYNGDVVDVQTQVNSGSVVWDVVDVEPAEAKLLCDQGLLELIDSDSLPPAPDGTSALADFYSGTLSPCGVGSIIWSTVIAFDTSLFDGSPATIADFFDTNSFPGKRGVRNNPQGILEMALMADGVPPNNVYSELASAAGIDQAFQKLDQIKDDILWWDTGAQSMQQLIDGTVAMTTSYNGRVFNETVGSDRTFATLWDAQVWNMDLWVIPKGTANLDLAMDFVRFSTATEQLARQASYISYGPARRSSYALVGNHFELNIDMKPNLPTAPQNFRRVLQTDHEFWAANSEVLNERFSSWRNQ